MMKDVLFNKLNGFKGVVLILLFSAGFSLNIFAQTKQVTGKVTSADDGTALPGVSIKVKGGSAGSVSDVKGNYTISAPVNSTLVFSYVGYSTQEISIGAGDVYDVKLSESNKNLNEIVVVGYGTQKRKDLTGSISSVNAAAIAKVPVTTLDQAIQGRAAGVQVTNNDASPGGNVTVLIRGTGSLAQGGNGPLYVIDGYPVSTGGINNINPNDIASIDILKDASATAIYGIRAANGVVIITTKKGKKDGVQVFFDAYNSLQAKPKEYKVLNAQQFATLALQQAADDPAKQFTVLSNWNNPASLTEADWQNAVYRTGLTQSYNLGIRGGNDKLQSATSIGYYNQKGIVLGSYFKRITLSENLDYQPLKWLKSSTSTKYSYQDSNNPFGTNSNSTSNLGQLAQLPPTLDGGNSVTSQISDGKGNYGFFNPIYTYVAKYANPVYGIETNRYENIGNYLLANSSLEATIIDGLKIKTNAGVTVTEANGSYFQPEDDRLVNQYGAQAGATQNAQYSQYQSTSFDWVWENTISYDKTFGKHTINFVGGVSEQKTTYNGFSGSGVPPNSVIRDLSQVVTNTLKLNSTAQVIDALASQFARLGYNYENRYYITGTVRRDGSSKFDVGHQYGTFPSGSLMWKAKDESFLKNVDWLYDLKFRGGYGEVGNQGPVPDFKYPTLYSYGSLPSTSGNLGYPFGKTGSTDGTYQSGIAAIQPANPNLRWETDYQTDIGMDASFLHGDLSVTVDYFNRRSKDFLLNVAVPPQTGYTTESKNVGSMNNKGWEFAVNYNHNVNRDFKFGAGVTVSVIKNTLTSLLSGTTFITNPVTTPGQNGQLALNGNGWGTFTETNIGQPVGEFYGYKSLGILTQAQLTALNAAAQAKGFPYYEQAATAAGDRYYADTNGDGHVTADDQTSLGSPQPKFFGGLNLDATYKSWDFNVFFYGVYGNKILNYEESNLETFQNRGFVGVENLSQEYYANAWTSSKPSNTYARIYYNDNSIGNAYPSSAWIENGSYLKLKTLTVGYTLPPELVKKISLTRIRVYVSTQNLFTITSYKGLDPEIGAQGGYATQNGVDNGTYPSSRFYTLGLNVTF
jgi:TonB-linked SusC/RagA family outer membrane protein